MRQNPDINHVLRLLRWFCPPHLLEEIEGDLLQRYERNVKLIGVNKAKRKLIWDAIKFFRPGILLRNNLSIQLTTIYMLSNYLKVAIRVMVRNKTFSAINVSGLTLGITGALLLFLWIKHEFSYEQFHENKNELYIAWNRAIENGKISCWPTTPRILAPTLEKEYTAVDNAVSYAQWESKQLFTVGDTRIMKTTGIYTNPAFLTMFSFPLLKGDRAKALSDPSSIVITESFAQQLFGHQEALGESLKISQDGYSFDFVVSGVLQDLPPNTDFKFEYLIPFSFLESLGENDTFWGNNSVATLVKLKKGTRIESVNDQIKDVEKKHYADGQHIEIFLYPLEKMRLYSRFENGVAVGGRIEIMRLLGILGICLIAVACINFINLSTARAQRRAKEVAVRKVTGAIRFSLIAQFLCESILIALCAGLFSVLVAYFTLPLFNNLIHQSLILDFENINFWAGAVVFIMLIGILAGSYPSLYLSSFRPAGILKDANLSVGGKNILRTLLVVFQFGFAVTLIVSVIVVRKQINYVQNRDSGYSRDNLVYVPLTGDLKKNYSAFRNELYQSGAAYSVTKTSAPLTEQWSSTTGIDWRGKAPEERTDFQRIYADENLSTTFSLQVLQGRDMDIKRFSTDSTAAILNETALKIMGFKNPIGEIIRDNGRDWHVIGVVKDFVFLSPFQKIEPIILFGCKPRWTFNDVYVKFNNNKSMQSNLEILSQLSKKYNPDYPVEYHFADIEYQRKFNDMQATLKITTVFTSISIFIACLGLLGLAIYMTEARVKEIGIRKVLGGSIIDITKLLGYSSLKPILISIVLFLPISWLAMNWWLKSYAYRTQLDGWIFLLTTMTIVLIASLTVGINTIRAASANPVESLRNE